MISFKSTLTVVFPNVASRRFLFCVNFFAASYVSANFNSKSDIHFCDFTSTELSTSSKTNKSFSEAGTIVVGAFVVIGDIADEVAETKDVVVGITFSEVEKILLEEVDVKLTGAVVIIDVSCILCDDVFNDVFSDVLTVSEVCNDDGASAVEKLKGCVEDKSDVLFLPVNTVVAISSEL